MADQSPFSVLEFAERGRLAFELLHPVLAEHAQARAVSFLDPLRFHDLADGHQCDRTSIAAHTSRGAGDSLANLGDVVRYRHGASVSFSFQFPGAIAR